MPLVRITEEQAYQLRDIIQYTKEDLDFPMAQTLVDDDFGMNDDEVFEEAYEQLDKLYKIFERAH